VHPQIKEKKEEQEIQIQEKEKWVCEISKRVYN